MSKKYSCFISACHGKHELVQGFVPQLKKDLEAHLEPYIDEKSLGVFCSTEHIILGNLWERTIAQAICHSLCMIIVYSPNYDNHPECLRELRAMEILQESRLKRLGRNVPPDLGMIIPVVWRGDIKNLPPRISIHQCCDFTKITTAKHLKNRQSINKIESIAVSIYNLYKHFEKCDWDPFEECASFNLPSADEILPLWDSYVFSWEEIPGKDNGRLKEFLIQRFDIGWVKNAKIEKIEDDKAIRVFTKKDILTLKLNNKKDKVILELDNARIDILNAKMEKGKLNIYWDSKKHRSPVRWGDN